MRCSPTPLIIFLVLFSLVLSDAAGAMSSAATSWVRFPHWIGRCVLCCRCIYSCCCRVHHQTSPKPVFPCAGFSPPLHRLKWNSPFERSSFMAARSIMEIHTGSVSTVPKVAPLCVPFESSLLMLKRPSGHPPHKVLQSLPRMFLPLCALATASLSPFPATLQTQKLTTTEIF